MAWTLTVKVEGVPAVHLAFGPARPVEETAVTVLDQAGDPAWTFQEVVQHGLAFLLLYWWE